MKPGEIITSNDTITLNKGREGSAVLLPRLVGCRTHQRLLPWVAIRRRAEGPIIGRFRRTPT